MYVCGVYNDARNLKNIYRNTYIKFFSSSKCVCIYHYYINHIKVIYIYHTSMTYIYDMHGTNYHTSNNMLYDIIYHIYHIIHKRMISYDMCIS